MNVVIRFDGGPLAGTTQVYDLNAWTAFPDVECLTIENAEAPHDAHFDENTPIEYRTHEYRFSKRTDHTGALVYTHHGWASGRRTP